MNQHPPDQPNGRKIIQKPQSSALRTLGPVPDLEQHLPSDWWRTLFNSFYLKTDGDVIENIENTHHEVETVIRAASLEPNDRILDLCCGQGRHSLELARRKFRHVIGVDRSRYLIRLARKRARQEGLTLAFHEGDARRFRLKDQQFNAVLLMGNSFGYFEQKDDDEAVLKNVARVLAPHGTLVLDVVDGDWMREHFERRTWEWIDQNHFVCRERALSKNGDRIVAREVIVHAERGVIADQFYAERLYNHAQLTAVMEKVGFQSPRLHGLMQAGSTRGQDLGMMAHRLLMTALAPRRVIMRRKPAAPAFPDVTVLLGDPTLPDQVKLGGKFNDEDIDTIDRLKSALAELGEFKFTYGVNHQNLIRELIANPPAFVLNFCDEGYQNNAFMELHVPAILEMLNIPFSGAGPTCLGLCYNKSLIRFIAESLDVPTPMESFLDPDDTSATLASTFPALVKPNFGDSSVGITMQAVVNDPTELLN
ncbi:MAG: methyltransferase domain-containing protein, partial [Calditrichota bacterium]